MKSNILLYDLSTLLVIKLINFLSKVICLSDRFFSIRGAHRVLGVSDLRMDANAGWPRRDAGRCAEGPTFWTPILMSPPQLHAVKMCRIDFPFFRPGRRGGAAAEYSMFLWKIICSRSADLC